ncbi:MAG: hypothetical protein ACYCO3_12560 [Mycobacteriales bacterium]
MSRLTKLAVPATGAKLAKKSVSPSGGLTEQVGPVLESAREQLEAARDRVLPAVERVRDQIVPAIETARERIPPVVGSARDQLKETLAPALTEFLSDAQHRSGPARVEARRRGEAALAALLGQPVHVGRRRRWPLALLSLLAGFGLGAALGYLNRPSGVHSYPDSQVFPTVSEPTIAPSAPPPSPPPAG